MSERMFPIQSERGAKPHPTSIPWSIAELAYSVYSSKYGRSQSLERLAERHGFGPSEMDEFVPDWRERCDENKQLRDENKRLRAMLLRKQVHHDPPCTLCGYNGTGFYQPSTHKCMAEEAALTPQGGKGGESE